MDQDSGRKAGRSMPRRENGAGPRHRLGTDRPPSGAANPLPRRSAQGHIEPQLRLPGGAGTGTPFTPFGPDSDPAPGGDSTPGSDTDRGASDTGRKAAPSTGAGAVSRAGAEAASGAGTGPASDGGAETASRAGAEAPTSASVAQASSAGDDAAPSDAAADFHDGTRRGRRTEPPAS